MARIAGVDLPENKRVDIGLTYIYGIGRSNVVAAIKVANVDAGKRIKDLTDDQVVALVRNRVGSTTLVSDDIIKKLWHLSARNPRRLLQRLDKIFRYAVENMESEIKDEHLGKIFDDIKPKAESAANPIAKKEEHKEERKAPKKKPKKHWKKQVKKKESYEVSDEEMEN